MNLIRKFNNTVWFNLLLTASVLAVLTSQPAMAEFWGGGAPDWSDNSYYTNQRWTFSTQVTWDEVTGLVDPPVEPDEGYVNHYDTDNKPGLFRAEGTSTMPGAWTWSGDEIMEDVWYGIQGVLGGMGEGNFDFSVPIADVTGITTVWVQYVAYIRDSAEGSALAAEIAYNDTFIDSMTSDPAKKSWEQIEELNDSGVTGNWWRITEMWEINNAGERLYLRVNADVEGRANLVDSVQIMTIAAESNSDKPKVKDYSPRDGATGVSLDTEIKISFSKKMDTESAENAFSITPKVDGGFSWSEIDDVLTFTLDAPLTPLKAFEVTVSTDAKDVSGYSMADPFSFTFTTEDYTAPDMEIQGGPTETDERDTLSITVGGIGVYGYRYSLDGGDWSQAAEISAPLELTGLTDGEHTLKIKVLDGKSDWINTQELSWTVMTPPRIVSKFPRGKSQTTEKIVVDFSEAMNTESVKSALKISPAAPGVITWNDEKTKMTYTPDSPLNPDSNYTVTIGTGARDQAGNALSELHSWSFTTLNDQVLICDVSEDTYVLMGGMGGGAGYPKGNSKKEPKLKAGAVSIVDARALIRFDLSPIIDKGLTAEDVVSAYLVYTMLEKSTGMDVGHVAPERTSMYGFIHALDTQSKEKTGETTTDPFFWNEDNSLGTNYVDMDNKPGYVKDAPVITVCHSTGPNSKGRVDIAPLVRGWLDRRWANNGIELRDQDDQSDPTSDIGDGYSWHLASREDTEQAPYLEVLYTTKKLRIKKLGSLQRNMSFGEEQNFSAGGGNTGKYEWQALGPDGSDISDSTLSETSGADVTFTAPELTGVVTIKLTSGNDKPQQIRIGIGEASGNDIKRAPLYFPDSLKAEADSLNKICSDVLGQMESFSMVAKIIHQNTGDKETDTGGTCQDEGAEMIIKRIDNPLGLSESVNVSIETSYGKAAMDVRTDCGYFAKNNRIYAVLVDIGNQGSSNPSSIFVLGLYDENGESLSEYDEDGEPKDCGCGLAVTIPFNDKVLYSGKTPNADGSYDFDPFVDDGDWEVCHASNLTTFLSNTRNPDKPHVSAVPYSDLGLDKKEHTVTFITRHCSVYGVLTTEGEWPAPPNESLGGGCFIQNLLSGKSVIRQGR